jgi:hypothetical protein
MARTEDPRRQDGERQGYAAHPAARRGAAEISLVERNPQPLCDHDLLHIVTENLSSSNSLGYVREVLGLV